MICLISTFDLCWTLIGELEKFDWKRKRVTSKNQSDRLNLSTYKGSPYASKKKCNIFLIDDFSNLYLTLHKFKHTIDKIRNVSTFLR